MLGLDWKELYKAFMYVSADGPGMKLFVFNVIAAGILSFAYFIWVIKSRPLHESGKTHLQGVRNDRGVFSRRLFNAIGLRKKLWLNRSSRVELGCLAVNWVVKVFLLAPFVGSSFLMGKLVLKGLETIAGERLYLEPSIAALAIFTLISFVIDDFSRFYTHRLMHTSWLWAFHTTHHSARVLTPLTRFRSHPVEAIIGSLRGYVSYGLSLGLFWYLFDGRFTIVTLFGVNLFGEIAHLITASLRHSQVPIGYGVLELIFMSPAQHQIHHSTVRSECESNYGYAIAIWDHLGGSVLYSKEKSGALRSGSFRYGVKNRSAWNFKQNFIEPFQIAFGLLLKTTRDLPSSVGAKEVASQKDVSKAVGQD